MKKQHFFLVIICLISIHGCSPNKQKNHHESIPDDELYTLPGLEHGLIQSPINILTSTLQDADEHQIEVATMHDDKATAVVNKGHTIELEFEPGTEVFFDGDYYDFIQAHFHTPSEHQVDGMTFPMEMHFVCIHKEIDQEKPKYLVIAAFFKMGKENKFMDGFIDKIPDHKNDTILLAENPVYISRYNST